MNRLDVEHIRGPIGGASRDKLEALEVFEELGSTNSYLLEQVPPPPGRFRVALAETQSAGRGRLGREWHSPPGTGLCLSISYTFESARDDLPCLTLAVGVAIAELLEELGIRGAGLKWPNDLVLRDSKLGGILTEVRTGDPRQANVVVGIGINVDLGGPDGIRRVTSRIGHAADLAMSGVPLPTRSELSARFIERIFNTLAEFEADGFGRFHDAWPAFDWLRGQRICVETPQGTPRGVCQGIDVDGTLIVQTADGRTRFHSGTVLLHGQKGCEDV